MHLGLQIKIARIKNKLTQHQLAEKIHKTRPLISTIEQTGIGNILTIKKICKVLDIPYSDENGIIEQELSEYQPQTNARIRSSNLTVNEKELYEKQIAILNELLRAKEEIILHLRLQIPKKKKSK